MRLIDWLREDLALFDWLWRDPPIADRAALADFLDTRAAFLSQKSIFDYARGRSGPYFTMMLKEASFQANVEAARWKTYPFGLSILAEMVQGVLRPVAGEPVRLAAGLREVAFDAFDRYPVPAPLDTEQWMRARADLALRIEQIPLHPPKPVKDIPVPFAQVYFDTMPIHERLRENDFALIRDHLRINLVSMHRDFAKRADLAALAAAVVPAADESVA